MIKTNNNKKIHTKLYIYISHIHTVRNNITSIYRQNYTEMQL